MSLRLSRSLILFTLVAGSPATRVNAQSTTARPVVPTYEVGTPAIDRSRFDTTVSPCADFFRYVNGRWLTPHPGVEPLNAVILRDERIPQTIVEEARRAALTTNDPITKLVGTFDESCVRDTSDAVDGAPGSLERSKACYEVTRRLLGPAISELYVRQVFPASTRAAAQRFIAALKTAVVHRIEETSWLTAETKMRDLGWFAQVSPMIGMPEQWADYSRITFSRTDFVGNRTKAEQLPPVAWGSPLFDGELFTVHIVKNYFPASALIPPFFDTTADAAVTYGAGALYGHELMHNFDALKEWWSVGERASFETASRGVLAPYKAANIDDRYSHQSEQEHLADVTGLQVAYDAYTAATRDHPLGVKNGLTADQRFFVAYATALAYMYRTFVARTMMNNSGLDRDRVNIAVAQVPAFARAFSCPAPAAPQPIANPLYGRPF